MEFDRYHAFTTSEVCPTTRKTSLLIQNFHKSSASLIVCSTRNRLITELRGTPNTAMKTMHIQEVVIIPISELHWAYLELKVKGRIASFSRFLRWCAQLTQDITLWSCQWYLKYFLNLCGIYHNFLKWSLIPGAQILRTSLCARLTQMHLYGFQAWMYCYLCNYIFH